MKGAPLSSSSAVDGRDSLPPVAAAAEGARGCPGSLQVTRAGAETEGGKGQSNELSPQSIRRKAFVVAAPKLPTTPSKSKVKTPQKTPRPNE